MNKARYFSLGMDDMRQLGLSNVSLQYYLHPAPADLGAAARSADAKYDLLPPAPYSQFQDAFSHLGGYGAAYYTYRWSIVIADDLFTKFEANACDAATAAYRRLVLAPGGTKPAAQLIQDFLGRPLQHRCLSGEDRKRPVGQGRRGRCCSPRQPSNRRP